MSEKDLYVYSATGVAIITICGIIVSPNIPVLLGFTAIGAIYGLFSLKQINKLDEKNNK